MSKKEEIVKKALEILSLPEARNGLRFASLVKRVSSETGTNLNTCNGNLYNLPNELPDKVSRPSRGLFILKENEKFLKDTSEEAPEQQSDIKLNEEGIYEPARNHLLGNGECTHAVIVGGNSFGKKWGTPDIVGVIRADSDAVYKPILEIIAVEVKNEGYDPVEALGQAMAYKLFAHRTWLVLPHDNQNEIERIQGIAITANIGLISFTGKDKDLEFTTLNRPTSGCPDIIEVNKMLEKLKRDRPKYIELIKNEKC